MESAQAFVFDQKVTKQFDSADEVKGFDFNDGLDYAKLFDSYRNMGIQSTNLHKAIELVNKMLAWRDDQGGKCKVYFGYTSNMISSGVREIIRFLCQHKLVDVIVTTAGGVEEDFIKCLAKSYVARTPECDKELRRKGVNRIGNMYVPNDNYCLFEDWLTPIFAEMNQMQIEQGINWTPSKLIDHLGMRIDNEESVYYWCHKNNIPVFCPAITDGSLGDMLFFNSYKNSEFKLDLVEDIRRINNSAFNNSKTGCIVLGGGVVKHHIMNANLMRNGADYVVYINTAIEYDCSDAGATTGEAYSWGKIAIQGESVKVYSEASLVFPILVAESFYKHLEKSTSDKNQGTNKEDSK